MQGTSLSSHENFTFSNQFLQHFMELSLVQKPEREQIPNAWSFPAFSTLPLQCSFLPIVQH